MKLKKIVSVCALATGLATFATSSSQAGVVIENTLFTPLNIKLVATYNDPKTGKLKQVSLSTKDFLKTFGYDKGDQLAVTIGDGGTGDVYVINKNSVITDLTEDGNVFLDSNELVSHESGNKNSDKYSSAGTLTIDAYSDPVFDPEFDQSASEDNSDFWVEASGIYSYTETESAPDKNGNSSRTTSLTAGALTGEGFDVDLNDESALPVSGSVSGKGSGKVTGI